MPVARLITYAAQDADELAADLRSRGFEVEIASPANIPNHSVDLVIRVEECASEQALRNAEELSKAEDIQVFIAPGAIIESLRPMITVPLVPESEEEVTAQVEAIAPAMPEEIVTVQQVSALVAAEDVVDDPVEAIVLPPLVQTESAFSGVQPSAPQEVFAELQEVVSQQLAASGAPVEEQISAHALEAEEVYPPSDWPIWQPLVDEQQEELVPVAAEVSAVGVGKPAAGLLRDWQNDRLFWRVAVVTSVVAIATLLLGVSAHRFSPLPRNLQNASDERVPFQKVTSDSALPQTAAEVSPAPPAEPAAEFKRVVARVPVVERPSPAEHLSKHVSRSKGVERAATRQRDDFVAEDTVVRFGKKPSPPMQAQKRSSIKHYSDLR
jgi:hypothetical protein